MCSSIIRIESLYFKLEKQKYYPQAILEECRIRPNNNASRLDESDESDDMPEKSGYELNSDYGSDESDGDNES